MRASETIQNIKEYIVNKDLLDELSFEIDDESNKRRDNSKKLKSRQIHVQKMQIKGIKKEVGTASALRNMNNSKIENDIRKA